MRNKPRVSCFFQRRTPFQKGGANQGTLPGIPHLFPRRAPFRKGGGMPVGSASVSPPPPHWSPQVWTRARWLTRASTGTPQTVASAVVAAVEPCWAALSCHAVASSSAPEPAALDRRPPLRDPAAAAGAQARSPHRSQLPQPLSLLRKGRLRPLPKAPVPRPRLVRTRPSYPATVPPRPAPRHRPALPLDPPRPSTCCIFGPALSSAQPPSPLHSRPSLQPQLHLP
jgi:hypothetical protein